MVNDASFYIKTEAIELEPRVAELIQLGECIEPLDFPRRLEEFVLHDLISLRYSNRSLWALTVTRVCLSFPRKFYSFPPVSAAVLFPQAWKNSSHA